MATEYLLRHLHLHVGDVQSVCEWYSSVLGLETIYANGDQLAILGNRGDCQLGLEAGPPVSEPERIHLIFRVPDVDALYEELRLNGAVEHITPPADQPYGHRVFAVRDPIGHTVELYTPLEGHRPYD